LQHPDGKPGSFFGPPLSVKASVRLNDIARRGGCGNASAENRQGCTVQSRNDMFFAVRGITDFLTDQIKYIYFIDYII
jgi:hypothetical protein